MPTYDYECENGHAFEKRCSMQEREDVPHPPCPTCTAPSKQVLVAMPFLNDPEVVILDYPGSKRLKAGYLYSHGDADVKKVSVGAGGALNPSTKPVHPVAEYAMPDWGPKHERERRG